MKNAIESLITERATIRRVSVPEMQEWVSEKEAQHYRYEKSWDEAKLNPWIIIHTSGTTGAIGFQLWSKTVINCQQVCQNRYDTPTS